MKKGKKFMLVIALLLTVLPLVGCGEKIKEAEMRTYQEENYTEVNEDTIDNHLQGVAKSYITNDATVITVRRVHEQEGKTMLVLNAYGASDDKFEKPIWTYKTATVDEEIFMRIECFQNVEDKDIIFIIEENKLSLLDTKTGKIKWTNADFKNDINGYLVANGNLYIMNRYDTKNINIVNIETGKTLKVLNFKQISSFDIRINNLVDDELNITDYIEEKNYSININTNSIKEDKIFFPIIEENYSE